MTRFPLLLALLPAAAQVPPPPALRHFPPPVVATPLQQQLLAWMPGEVRCAGTPVQARLWRRPYQSLSRGPVAPAPVTYRFRLDAAGRALSIAREALPYAPYADDIGPSLAATRFAAGGERRDCTVTYTARLTAYADTPVADLISYTMTPTNGRLPREGWTAIYPAAATCDDEPRPAPLTQAFPDFAKVAGTPGSRDWTMFAYDLDAGGAPTRITVLAGTGNNALDAAGAAALARSRYTGGPRTGCRYPYWKAAEILPAPPTPERADQRDGCRAEWASRPPLRYPASYRRRSIEGWADIGFDVAPWGATGNVAVLASEPAAEFGEQAATLIRAAQRTASPTGATGCVERVRFVMGRPGTDPAAMVDD